MVFLNYIVGFLFISIVTGSTLIVYPIFFRRFIPDEKNIQLLELLTLLLSYEIGRLINYIFSKYLIDFFKMNRFVWILLLVSTVLSFMFLFTETVIELALVRLCLGIVSLQNQLQLIFNTIFNLKNSKFLKFISLSPNIIIIINFNIGYLLYSDLNKKASDYKSFYNNISKFKAVDHFMGGMFILIEYLLLILILKCCKGYNFQDSTITNSNKPEVENTSPNQIDNNGNYSVEKDSVREGCTILI